MTPPSTGPRCPRAPEEGGGAAGCGHGRPRRLRTRPPTPRREPRLARSPASAAPHRAPPRRRAPRGRRAGFKERRRRTADQGGLAGRRGRQRLSTRLSPSTCACSSSSSERVASGNLRRAFAQVCLLYVLILHCAIEDGAPREVSGAGGAHADDAFGNRPETRCAPRCSWRTAASAHPHFVRARLMLRDDGRCACEILRESRPQTSPRVRPAPEESFLTDAEQRLPSLSPKERGGELRVPNTQFQLHKIQERGARCASIWATMSQI